jgi:hypothetical protein
MTITTMHRYTTRPSGGNSPPKAERPTFRLVLRAEPGVDAVHALRHALKALLRRFGLRSISCEREQPR